MRKPIIKRLVRDTGLSATDRVTGDATPTLSGTAQAGATVTIYDKGKIIGTVKANADGKWIFTTRKLKDGVHDFTAKAAVGSDVSGFSTVFKTTIDRKAPAQPTINLDTASDTGASATDGITSATTLTLGGNAEAGARVTVLDGATLVGIAIATAAGNWTLTTAALADGVHNFSATATDKAGNLSPVSLTRTITIDSTAPAAPSTPDLAAASDLGSSAGDNLTSDATPTLTGTAEAGATVTIRDGATVLGAAVADGSGNWSFTTGVLANGIHGIAATATDQAGNVGAPSPPLVLAIDTTAPAPPVITGYGDDTGTIGDGITADSTLTITGTAEANSTVNVFDGATLLGSTTASGSGVWTYVTAALTATTHSFAASATDAAGNAGAASASLPVTVLGPNDIDLTTLSTAQGFIIQGDDAFDYAGSSVASAGDVNGDGFDDLIVGAPLGDDGGSAAGEAYVVFGTASGFGTVDSTGRAVIDLTNLTAAQGFIIQGDNDGDQAGYSVSSAGDVNGDGFDDLIVGAPFGGPATGEAYVLFGKASGFGSADGTGRVVIDLANVGSSFTAAEGFIIQSDAGLDLTGSSVSSAGDVNGDGFDELIVGARFGDDGGYFAGEAYVVFGKASGFGTDDGTGRAVIDLANVGSSFTAAEGFIIQGDAAYDEAGYSVASAGDVNGDGFGDLIVGAPFGDDGDPGAGESYVVFGKASSFGTVDGTGRAVIDLTNLTAGEGFIIQGDAGSDWAGFSVASAGDVNADGFDDLIVGAPFGSDGGSATGEAYVVFGRASGFGTVDGTGRAAIDLSNVGSNFTAARGFIIQGDAFEDQAGWSVASAGDVNGDGFDDLIVGASGGDDGGSAAGEAYVVFGKASGFGTVDGTGRAVIDLTNFAAPGFIIQGDSASDYAGWSVSSAGDVNGDGFDDLIVGAPFGNDGGTDAGEAYVLYGNAFGGSTAPVVASGTGANEIFIGGMGNDNLSGGGGIDVIRGGAGDDRLAVGDLTFRKVDGGTGTDTLAFTGGGETVDFAALTDGTIEDIEAFDVTGTGADTLIIGALDAFHFSSTPHSAFTGADSHNSLVVLGDSVDGLRLDGFDPDGGGGPIAPYTWELAASDKNLDGLDGGGFDFYNLVRAAAVLASVAVDADMGVVF